MNLKTITGIITLGIVMAFFTGCKENEAPAHKIIGTYSGSFNGTWQGNDTLVNSPNFSVTVSEISDNKVKVEGSLFYAFEVLVTNAGINVEPVADEPELPHFLYSGETKELDFDYVNGEDFASFTGIKN